MEIDIELTAELCQMMDTHISEDEEPHDRSKIPDFKTRWLANLPAHKIELHQKNQEGFKFLTKTVDEQNELVFAFKDGIIVLAYYYPLSFPKRLDTLTDNPDSMKAAEILGIEPEEMYDWQEVESIGRVPAPEK